MKVWNLESRRAQLSCIAHKRSVLSISCIDAGRFLTSGRDGKVCIWDTNSSNFAAGETTLSISCGAVHFCNSSSDRMSKGICIFNTAIRFR